MTIARIGFSGGNFIVPDKYHPADHQLPTWFESDSGLLRTRQHWSSTFHGHFIDKSWAIVDEMPMKCP